MPVPSHPMGRFPWYSHRNDIPMDKPRVVHGTYLSVPFPSQSNLWPSHPMGRFPWTSLGIGYFHAFQTNGPIPAWGPKQKDGLGRSACVVPAFFWKKLHIGPSAPYIRLCGQPLIYRHKQLQLPGRQKQQHCLSCIWEILNAE